MRSFQAVLLLCFIKFIEIQGRRFQNIHETAQIDNMSRIGRFVNIGANVRIGPNSEVGDFSNIASEVMITNGSTVGRYCKINRRVSIVNNARVWNYVNIGQHAFLHDNCEIRNYADIGSDAEIFENVLMMEYSLVEDDASVGAGSILDRYSSAFYRSRIGSNVYVGNYARIGENALIEDNAVISKYASVKDGAHVFRDEFIIQTQSSASLYSNCLPLDRIQQSQIDRILYGTDQSVNNILLDLMKQQLDQLSFTCPSANFNLLQLVKSLYLLRYHGRESYERNCRQRSGNVYTSRTISGINYSANSNMVFMGQNGIFINGQRVSYDDSEQTLSREFHFGSNDHKKILNDETKDHMIRLLAIENDYQRSVRVQGDTYCKMLENIKNKRRTCKCDT